MSTMRESHPKRTKAPSADELLTVLRDRIANHDLTPGSKLRERDLVEEFEAPRARIREVFGALAERGLIERIPNRGAIVARLDLDQAFDLFDIREVLEALSARLATEKQAPESWQDLVELFGEPTEAIVEAGDLEEYTKRLGALRERMIEGAENPLLEELLNGLYDRTRVLIQRLVMLPGRARQGLAQHQKTLAAMRRGDAREAERLQRENIRSARDSFQQYHKFIL